MRVVFASLIVAAFLLVPSAFAQAPTPTPTMTVTIQNAPAEFPTLASNGTAQVGFSVQVRVTNIVCPQATTIPVSITANAQSPPEFFTVAVEPADGSIPVTAGPHQEVSGSLDATLTAATQEITANASVPVEVVATASPPAGCQGAGQLSATSSEPVTVFANMTAPPPPPEPTPETNDSPAPGWALIVLVAAGVALARRNRRA